MRITFVRTESSTWPLLTMALLSFSCSDLVPIGGPAAGPEGGVVEAGVLEAELLENFISPNPRDVLGQICTSNADCSLLKCVKPTDTSMGGGGPAHGYCSAPCASVDDAICKAANGQCLNFAAAGAPAQNWCVQTCRRGGDAPDMNKCRGRSDVACTPSSVQDGQPSLDGYCLPTCNGDAECGSRHCDPASGVCIDAVTGDPTGTACSVPGGADVTDEDADEGADADTDAEISDDGEASVASARRSSDCAGVCLSVGASTHVCAQRCTYGSPTACHLPEVPIDGGAGTYSACLFVSKNTGPGDEAHCGQLCDTEADCLDYLDPGVLCNRSDEALKSFGHGFCDWLSPVVDAAGVDP